MTTASTDNNFDKVISQLEDSVGDDFTVKSTISNNVSYADALHAKDGYYVFNPRHFRVQVYLSLKALGGSPVPYTAATVMQAVEHGTIEEINFLRSHTDETQPPINSETEVNFTTREGEEVSFIAYEGVHKEPRLAHPGHWADRSGNLASGYNHDVKLLPV